MKKILFNDRYGLTEAVLEGRKTMTRRIVPNGTPLGNWEETIKKSRYKPGEVVAVAQSYEDAGYYPMGRKDEPGWRNKMFVRAYLMPHQIRITSVRMERLQDICDEDCIREGIVRVQWMYGCEGICERGYQLYFGSPRTAFAALIDKISGKGTWESNPWVFVYAFELVR